MKLNLFETHDRYKHFTKQSFDIAECCQDIINKRPFGEHPFYIFAHARTIGLDEKLEEFNKDLRKSVIDPIYVRKYTSLDQVPELKIIWQPRLTKPKSQTNSMLFKAYPGTDIVKTIWIIPKRELWAQYKKGNITENKTVIESINNFENHREQLDAKEDDDLEDWRIDQIYTEISLSLSQ